MTDTVTCPFCSEENAYFDGSFYTCPDCDSEWDDDGRTNADEDEEETNYEYQKLIKLKKPFFKLKHGKLYQCTVEYEKGIEEIYIIPLAKQKDRNCQFFMADAKRLFQENPKYIYEIIKMDFNYIWNDGILSNYPSDYNTMTNIFTTQKDHTLLDCQGMVYSDFIETDVIK